jgi:sugar lactone lactonase YvrE
MMSDNSKRPALAARLMLPSLAFLALLLGACGGSPTAVSSPSPAQSVTASAIPELILKNLWATAPDFKKLGTPNYLAVDRNDDVYVADITNYAVVEFDHAGKFVRRFNFPANGQMPTGIAVDAGGNVYAADAGKSRIIKFDSRGRLIKAWPTLTLPVGVAVDGAGDIFVAGHRVQDHYIQKFDAAGKLLTEFGTTGKGDGQFFVNDNHAGLEQISTGPDGTVYVADPADYRVVEFDNNGVFVRNYVADPESTPRPLVGVAVDGAGNVYAASGGPLIKWGPDGHIVAHLPLAKVDSPWVPFLTANSGGDLWLSEAGHLNPDGESIGIVHRLTAAS